MTAPTARFRLRLSLAVLLAASGAGVAPCFAMQTPAAVEAAIQHRSNSQAELAESLPDAPEVYLAETHGFSTSGAAPEAQSVAAPSRALPANYLPDPRHLPPDAPIERRYTKYIHPGYRAQPLNTREKVILGFRDAYSFSDFGATLISAGYSHLVNGQPNYGTDSAAFGQRIGAAALREATEGIFTDSLFSVLEKEDPRYYVLGPRYGYVHRTLYAISRPLITRTDSGSSSPNGALLTGYAASAALAAAYYPNSNRNAHDAAANFGTSIGGAALGFFVSEFQDDFLIAVHLKKKP